MKNFHIFKDKITTKHIIKYHFRLILRALLFDITKSDLVYLRMYNNAKENNLGFEFQDGVILAKESLILKLRHIVKMKNFIMKIMKIFRNYHPKSNH